MNDTHIIECYINGTMKPGDKLVMDAKLIIDADLQEKMFWQKRTYALINDYGRKKLKLEIEQVHNLLFSENRFMGFRQKIKNIFK